MLRVISSLLTLVLFYFSFSAKAVEDFPARKEFKDIPIYEINQLHNNFDKVVIVDVRSHYEYNTLHINGALNIPVALEDFEQQVAKLRSTTNKPIAFYCNGHTCHKSYIAVKKAKKANIKDTFAYDAGIFDWARAYPQLTTLLGKSPINVKDLIDKKEHKARFLDPNTFSTRAWDDKSIVLDVRDKFQRAGVGFFPGKEYWASLDEQKKIHRYLAKAIKENKILYIYDETGKQVEWLQYLLQQEGVKNYYFMDKGATGYYNMLAKSH